MEIMHTYTQLKHHMLNIVCYGYNVLPEEAELWHH